MLLFLAMETKAHLTLKRMAADFLRMRGCQILAGEVACPISRYRIDVAGYMDTVIEGVTADGNLAKRRCEPRTIFIECKQSREDFLRDAQQLAPLLDLREKYQRICASIEENRIKRLEPQLRKTGSSLFAELDEWDFSGSRLAGYRRVLRRLRRLDEKLHGETKFFLVARYRLADEMYLAAPPGLIKPRELPHGWGLLEASDQACTMRIAVAAPIHACRPVHRHRLLRTIAAAACKYSWRGE